MIFNFSTNLPEIFFCLVNMQRVQVCNYSTNKEFVAFISRYLVATSTSDFPELSPFSVTSFSVLTAATELLALITYQPQGLQGERTCSQSCSLTTAVFISSVYTAHNCKSVYMSEYLLHSLSFSYHIALIAFCSLYICDPCGFHNGGLCRPPSPGVRRNMVWQEFIDVSGGPTSSIMNRLLIRACTFSP